jgi:phosphate transport system substrate-binding protein
VTALRISSALLLLVTSLSLAGQQSQTPSSSAEDRSKLPNYPVSEPEFVPGPPMPGTIRVWGNDFMARLEQIWEDGFHKSHPEIKFDDTLKSSAQAVGALYCNVADLGLLGREVWPTEVLGFQKMYEYEPLGIAAATGSFHTEGKTWPFVIFVNKSNPISKLTMQQLDAIYGTQLRRGAKEPITRWGQLGVTGPQASHPIHVYGYDMIIPGFTYAFQQIVFKGSDQWTGSLHEYTNAHRPDGKLIHTAGDLMLDDLAKDPDGIAFTGLQFTNPNVKYLAIAENEGGPYVVPSLLSTADRSYPMVRSIYILLNRKPGTPVDPKLKEFLRYVLSRQGQEDVVKEGDFLPLTPALLQEQLRKLE